MTGRSLPIEAARPSTLTALELTLQAGSGQIGRLSSAKGTADSRGVATAPVSFDVSRGQQVLVMASVDMLRNASYHDAAAQFGRNDVRNDTSSKPVCRFDDGSGSGRRARRADARGRLQVCIAVVDNQKVEQA